MEKKYEILNNVLLENKKIKDSIQNSILTILSGSLVLSFSLIQFLEYSEETIIFIKLSWILLIIGIISNILSRFFLTEVVRTEINKKEFEFDNHHLNIKAFFENFKPERKYDIAFRVFSTIHWCCFIFGLIGLLYFVWVNT